MPMKSPTSAIVRSFSGRLAAVQLDHFKEPSLLSPAVVAGCQRHPGLSVDGGFPRIRHSASSATGQTLEKTQRFQILGRRSRASRGNRVALMADSLGRAVRRFRCQIATSRAAPKNASRSQPGWTLRRPDTAFKKRQSRDLMVRFRSLVFQRPERTATESVGRSMLAALMSIGDFSSALVRNCTKSAES